MTRKSAYQGKHLVSSGRKEPKQGKKVSAENNSNREKMLPLHEPAQETEATAVQKEGTERQKMAEHPGAGKRRGASRKKTALYAVLALVVLIILVPVGFFFSKLARLNYDGRSAAVAAEEIFEKPEGGTEGIDQLDVSGYEMKQGGGARAEGEKLSERALINILIIGSDAKLPGTLDKGRADAVMLASFNKSTGAIKLASFERAMGVPVEGKKDYKLNDILNVGDAILIQETISDCFKVDIEGFVHVDYDSFPKVIDAIGGLDLVFTQQEANNLNARITLDARSNMIAVEGVNHLNGYDSLIYCRLRDSDDNWERQRRTRTVLSAFVEKVKGLSLTELNRLSDTVLPMIHTNLTTTQITGMLLQAPKFLHPDISQLMLPDKEKIWVYHGENEEAMFGFDFQYETERLHQFLLQEEQTPEK